MASRPPLNRKHTRTTEANRTSGLDKGVRITLDGVPYEVRAGDLTAVHTRLLRKEAGYGFARLLDLLEEDPDLDVIGTLVWLARTLNGDRVTIDEVLADIGYEDLDGMEVEELTEPAPEDNSPEA